MSALSTSMFSFSVLPLGCADSTVNVLAVFSPFCFRDNKNSK